MKEYQRIAGEMTGLYYEAIAKSLKDALTEANDLCVLCGGELVSRQAIASIIIAHRLMHKARFKLEGYGE